MRPFGVVNPLEPRKKTAGNTPSTELCALSHLNSDLLPVINRWGSGNAKLVELELYFSCQIRKRALFPKELPREEDIVVDEGIALRFHGNCIFTEHQMLTVKTAMIVDNKRML